MSIKKIGYLLAFATIIIWSSTYVSTKILIKEFSAIEISTVRFSIGLLILFFLAPPKKRTIKIQHELSIALTGFLGIFLYYYLENSASKNTYASNISMIVTVIPLITTLIGPLFFKDEKFHFKYIISFILSFLGIYFLTFIDGEGFKGISIKGDLLALAAAFTFSVYTLLLKKIGSKEESLLITRKTFQYGWIAIIIIQLTTKGIPDFTSIVSPPAIFHFLFLGIMASGLCFFMWSKSIQLIGALKTTQFIYLAPIITVSLSYIFLNEELNSTRIISVLLIITGVVISQFEIEKLNILKANS